MLRDTIATASAVLLPVLMLAITAGAAWLSALVAGHITSGREAAAVSLLAYGAAGVAADFAQHVVADLKDPTKAGTWSSVAGAAVRLRAVNDLRRLYPFAVDVLTGALRDPTKVDALLGGLLEKAVLDLKATTAPTAA